MKRNRNLVLLSHDHYHGLSLASLIKKDAPHFSRLPNDLAGKLRYTILKYDEELEKHFAEEEEILFPSVELKDPEIDSLIEEMLEEHCTMRETVTLLKSGLDITENLDKLGNLLEKHIRKEERILFAKIEEVLTDKELEEIGAKLNLNKKP